MEQYISNNACYMGFPVNFTFTFNYNMLGKKKNTKYKEYRNS